MAHTGILEKNMDHGSYYLGCRVHRDSWPTFRTRKECSVWSPLMKHVKHATRANTRLSERGSHSDKLNNRSATIAETCNQKMHLFPLSPISMFFFPSSV